MGEATTMQGFDMALLGTGDGMYSFDQQKWIVSSPGILHTLEFYQSIYADNSLGDARMQLVEDGRQRSFETFASGDIAMLVEGDWFWRSAILNVIDVETRNAQIGWAKMPAMEPGMGLNGQDFVSISGGGGLIMNPHVAHPQEAWALLSFIASQDATRAFELIQPRISFRDDVAVAGDPVMTAMAEALLPLSTVRPQLPNYAQVSAEAQLMTERVVSAEMTPMEAMEAYQQAVTELVGEDNVLVIPIS
jgi:multiple sugar transport system substrate-binding protein